MAGKMKIRFTETREVKDGEGKVKTRFQAGESYELQAASARHWLNRNAAVVVDSSAASKEVTDAKNDQKKTDGANTGGKQAPGGSR